jgi:adenosylmethionine-8-amino-7-oxononanoate aminotransferase
MSSLVDLDRAHLIHPFIDFKSHEANGTQIVRGGDGVRIHLEDGRSIIDGLSGLWNINVGHGRHEIGDAVAAQMQDIAYYPGVWDFATEPVIRLAARLAELVPSQSGIEHFMFTNGGSEANELNFRFARAYHAVRGDQNRHKILARRSSYHGITRAAAGATRLPGYHIFSDPDPEFIELPAPYRFRCKFCRGESACSLSCADAVEETIQREGPETISALIAEPVMATGGVIVPPDGYLPRLREICDRYGILLIFDEVVTGFGRTGKWFGMDTYDTVPDLVSFAKGITSGYLPLGACGISQNVYETLRDRMPEGLPFMATVTTGNHAACCAAANANLDIIENEGLVENAATMGAYMTDSLGKTFADHPAAGELRGVGMMAAIEWSKPGTSDRIAAPSAFPSAVSAAALERGLIVRTMGEVNALAPPLVATRADIDEIISILCESATLALEQYPIH